MFRSLRLAAAALGAAGLFALLGVAVAGEKTPAGFKSLFNGKDLTGWKIFPEKAAKAFSVKDGVIDVSGKPAGYVYTDKSYTNYVLRYDWKFLKDGNSGLLVHIQGHKVWPKSLEVQGMQKSHGSIIPINIKATHKTDAKAQKKAIKIGEWNTTEVTVKNGKVDTKINGIPVSTATITSDDVKTGPFGFQSEGSPLQFKNIQIKVLD